MNSFLLPCRVKHNRYAPTEHSFEYPVRTCLLDLDDLSEIDRSLKLFGYNRFSLASLLDSDYLTSGSGTIPEKLSALMADNGLEIQTGDKVYLVTSPRLMNYVFNPVSFYWVFRDGEHIGCVAEVNNTFGEKHVYPLSGHGDTEGFPAEYQADKTFHVSPFFDRTGRYHFNFSDIRKNLAVSVTLIRDGSKNFEAEISEEGERIPLTDGNLLKSIVSRPFTSHLTFPRILWEAGKIHYGKKIGYHPKPEPMTSMTIRHISKNSKTASIYERIVRSRLRKMKKGTLLLESPTGKTECYGSGNGFTAHIIVKSPEFYRKVLFHGEIGLGEAYSQGWWDSPDLPCVVLFFLGNNRDGREGNGVLNRLGHRACGFLDNLRHEFAPRNDEAGSKENISAHYDLSNELFKRFLDPTMSYSSAVFLDPSGTDEDLGEAQKRKNRLLADRIQIGPDDHVLEIGCGWGGFLQQTAIERGCRITGVTISEEQYRYAVERIRKAGLEDRVSVLLKDYRKITDKFDKIVSVEMLEAVGHDFHPEFFRTIDRLLKPSGLAVIQSITIQDSHYDRYRWGMDWIRKHIFPGGLLPSLTRICEVTSKDTALVVQSVESIGPHYASTLRRWREKFNLAWEDISAHGFDEYFKRTWNYYFALCEAGFDYGHINNIQFVLSRAEPLSIRKCCSNPECRT